MARRCPVNFTLIHDTATVSHRSLPAGDGAGSEGLGIDELIDSGKPVLIEWGESSPDCSLPRSRRSGWSISEKIQAITEATRSGKTKSGH